MGGGRRDIYAGKQAVRRGSRPMFCASSCVRAAIRQEAGGNRVAESIKIHSVNSTGLPNGRPNDDSTVFPKSETPSLVAEWLTKSSSTSPRDTFATMALRETVHISLQYFYGRERKT